MARTAAEKTTMYNAMVGMITVIDNCLDDSNDFCNDLTNAEKQERVLRSAGYMSAGVALSDWGSENMSTITAAIAAANAYSP